MFTHVRRPPHGIEAGERPGFGPQVRGVLLRPASVFGLLVLAWLALVFSEAMPPRVATTVVVSVVVVLVLVRFLLAERAAWRRQEVEQRARREEAARRAGTPHPDVVLPDLAGARRRAFLRALGGTLVAGSTLVLLWTWAARAAYELGIYANHLQYLLLLITVVYFVRRERVEMRRSESERTERRRRRGLRATAPRRPREAGAPAGPSGLRPLRRMRAHFAPGRAGPAYDTLLLILIVGACVGTALVVLFGFAGRR